MPLTQPRQEQGLGVGVGQGLGELGEAVFKGPSERSMIWIREGRPVGEPSCWAGWLGAFGLFCQSNCLSLACPITHGHKT